MTNKKVNLRQRVLRKTENNINITNIKPAKRSLNFQTVSVPCPGVKCSFEKDFGLCGYAL